MRAVLLAVGVALAACGSHSLPPAPPRLSQPNGWDDALRPVELDDLDPSPDAVEYRLEAKVQQLELVAGKKTPMWTYNGLLPGPMIHATRGQRLTLHFTNHLPEATSIHWHGLHVPVQMDGADQSIPSGGTFDYAFTLTQAGTYWYHSHVHSTAQVGFGLYGALVVDDPDEPFLGDPVVMLIADASVKADGTLAPGDESGWFGDYFGREGDLLLVNGKRVPTLKARQGVPQRWKLINGSRARYLKFNVPGQALVRIGGDGGLCARGVPISQLTLAPGERAELYVNPQPAGPQKIAVHWQDSDRFHIGSQRPPEPMFTWELTGEPAGADAAPALPARLRDVPLLPIDGALTRSLEMGEFPDGKGATALGFNGRTFADGTPLMATVGQTEVWEVSNTTGYDHPFHLHGFSFQVLQLDHAAWPVMEWKDTVNVPGHQKVKFAVQWDDRPGMWMFHCHILDHLELGMGGTVMVVRP